MTAVVFEVSVSHQDSGSSLGIVKAEQIITGCSYLKLQFNTRRDIRRLSFDLPEAHRDVTNHSPSYSLQSES